MSEPKTRQRIREKDSHKAIYEIICLSCAGIILTISAYGVVASIMGHIDVVGATLVNVEVPPPSIFPLYVKPVSILMAAALGLTFSGFELVRPRMLRYSNTTYSFIKMVAFAGSALCAYEVMYNFAIWIAQLSTASLLGVLNPDILQNPFPNPLTPWNLVFATKLTTTVLAIGLYTFYFIRSLEKEKMNMT